jgi:hypothetical protein
MPRRTAIECLAEPNEVFNYIARGGISGLNVDEVDRTTKVITLRSSPTLLSWGERIELTINQSNNGSIIVFRGSSVHPINPTADVKGPMGKIIRALKNQFGIVNE